VDRASASTRKMAMVAGARRHLEAGHEKYILDIIQSNTEQVSANIFNSTPEAVNLSFKYGRCGGVRAIGDHSVKVFFIKFVCLNECDYYVMALM
jgi:hypothetical protein